MVVTVRVNCKGKSLPHKGNRAIRLALEEIGKRLLGLFNSTAVRQGRNEMRTRQPWHIGIAKRLSGPLGALLVAPQQQKGERHTAIEKAMVGIIGAQPCCGPTAFQSFLCRARVRLRKSQYCMGVSLAWVEFDRLLEFGDRVYVVAM